MRQLILRLTITTERLHAENSILKTRLKAATDVLAARREHHKGTRVSLKNQLVLTTDEAFAEAKRRKKKKRAKKPVKRGRKRKTQDVESESEDNESRIGSDSVLPPEIFDCIVVE